MGTVAERLGQHAEVLERAVEVYALLLMGDEISASLIVDRHASEEEGRRVARVMGAMCPGKRGHVVEAFA